MNQTLCSSRYTVWGCYYMKKWWFFNLHASLLSQNPEGFGSNWATIETPYHKMLKNLNPNKTTGPDGISLRVLKEFASEICHKIFTIIFQTSIDSETIPKDWKNANISPIHKKGDRTKASNYRPVSLTSVSCKLCEHIIHSHIVEFLDKHKILTTSQHSFRSGHSCETQLIQTIHDFTSALDNKTQTDVVIMDFSKAFDTVPHNRLLLKCSQYGVDGRINDWLSAILKDRKQCVVVGGDFSDWADVVSGVPQGTVLGPLLFSHLY